MVSDKEMKKVMKDAKEFGIGVIDQETGKRVNPRNLAFFWECGCKTEPITKEVKLWRDYALINKIYKEKFGKDSNPYDLKLFKKDEGLFVERMIRAVEICTMNYVLNTGKGSLNINKRPSIVKGRRQFLWEH